MNTIWISLSSHTKCVFHILREVGAKLNIYVRGMLILKKLILKVTLL
jgi:hypothetical protein